jgi:RNA polymerase sigma factor (sigma-70 family)
MPAMSMSHVLRQLRVLSDAQATHDLSDGELLERFRVRREETAFALLVQRHGPMVLGVCRRLLADVHSAEDAFQATFLVLVRKVASIRKQGSVASWLHGVARRIAVKARLRMARDQALGRQLVAMSHTEVRDEWTWQELRAVLDEELEQLPEKYRTPLVLCGLEGKTHEQAARELRCPKSSLSWRVMRARELLRARLTRRGITVSTAALAAVLCEKAAAAVPALLTIATVRAAMQKTGEAISANVATLTEEGIKAIGATKAKAALALVLLAGMAAAVSAFGYNLVSVGEPTQEDAKAAVSKSVRDGQKPRADLHGDPLPVGALARLGTTRFRHGHNVKGIAFSADGKFLASAAWDHTVRLWDAVTGEQIRSFGDPKIREDPYHVGRWAFCVAFSPDGKLLAAGHHSPGWPVGSLRVWEVASGKEQLSIEQAHQTGVLAVAFSPDSKSVASAGVDRAIRLWDVATGKQRHVFDGHTGAASGLAFVAGGKSLASAGADGTVRLWDVTSGKELHQFQGQHVGVGSLAVSADGTAVVSAGVDHTVRFWDAATGKELRKWTVPEDNVTVIALSADGEFLATAVGDKVLQIREAATGKVRHSLKDPRSAVRFLAFSPDGKTLAAAADNDNTLWLWDPATGKTKRTAGAHQDWISFLAFSADGKTLTSAGRDRTVRRWETASGKETGWFEGGHIEGRAVALAPDGQTLALGGADGTVSLRNPNTGKELRPLGKHQGPVASVAFSADGKSLASGGQDQIARLWDVGTGKERHQLTGHSGVVSYVAFSPDGKVVATGGTDNFVRVWDTASGKELTQLTAGQAPVVTVAFSPDSRLLAGGSTADGSVRLWEVASAKLLDHLKGHTGYVSTVDFSPDGRTLAAGCWRSVRLWEVATGTERGRLAGHRGDVGAIAFSPDGRRLTSGSSDTTILVWDLTGQLRDGQLPIVKLTAGQLKDLLAALAGNDSAAAYRAIWTLAAAPAQSVPLLKEHLRPVAPVDAKRLAGLIAALDDDAFDVREKASTELEKLGETAEGALRKALEGEPSPEVRQRVKALLEKVAGRTPSAERLRTVRTLEVLEQAGSPEARQILESLAKGAPGAWLTQEAQRAVARLARRSAGL